MIEDLFKENKLREDYSSYNIEDDPNGSIGIGLADAVYGACGRNVDKIPDWIHGKERDPLPEEEEKYLIFYKVTERNHLFPFNVYSGSDVKAKIIKEIIGYTKLITGKGVSTKIENCDSKVIGEVFKRLYQKSLKMQSKTI